MLTLERYNSFVDRMCAQHSRVPNIKVSNVFDDHRQRKGRIEQSRFARSQQQSPIDRYQDIAQQRYTVPTAGGSSGVQVDQIEVEANAPPAPANHNADPYLIYSRDPAASTPPATPQQRAHNPRHVAAQQEASWNHGDAHEDYSDRRRPNKEGRGRGERTAKTNSRHDEQRAQAHNKSRNRFLAAVNTERHVPAQQEASWNHGDAKEAYSDRRRPNKEGKGRGERAEMANSRHGKQRAEALTKSRNQ